MGFVDGKIEELEMLLTDVEVIEKPSGSVVELGSTVHLHIEGDEVRYLLVDESEADIMNGKISASSPIGSALVGKKVGDIIDVDSPSGAISYRILELS